MLWEGGTMKRIKLLFIVLLVSIIVFLSGCKNEAVTTTKGTVYTTIYPLYSITKLIAGQKLTVEKLVKDGAEIHSFEPSSRDIAKLTSAKAVIYLGLVDEWVKKPLEGTSVKIFRASEGIEFIDSDPHIWTSPRLLKKMARNIEYALTSLDPKNKSYYQENVSKLIASLDRLDKEFSSVVKNSKRKEFLIAHPSFGYLARDYSLKQYSITGVNEEEEPSAQKMKEIVQLIKEKNIKYILVDPNENLPAVKTIARDTGIKIVNIYGMGIVNSSQAKNETILSLMEKNLKAFEMVLK